MATKLSSQRVLRYFRRLNVVLDPATCVPIHSLRNQYVTTDNRSSNWSELCLLHLPWIDSNIYQQTISKIASASRPFYITLTEPYLHPTPQGRLGDHHNIKVRCKSDELSHIEVELLAQLRSAVTGEWNGVKKSASLQRRIRKNFEPKPRALIGSAWTNEEAQRILEVINTKFERDIYTVRAVGLRLYERDLENPQDFLFEKSEHYKRESEFSEIAETCLIKSGQQIRTSRKSVAVGD